MNIFNFYTPQDETFWRRWMYDIKKRLKNYYTFQ